MSISLAHFSQPYNFDWLQQQVIANGAIGRLLLACVLGAMVGLDREVHRKAAGVRTNLLICMGSALFTLLSAVLAGENGPKGQVASNIVQGIGFLGAGVILHNRSRISGLTSAASIWVVASIGMAAGAGLYATAAVGTVIAIVSLEIVGILERRGNLKGFPLVYEARGSNETLMLTSILDAMDRCGERLTDVGRDAIGDLQRINFVLTATSKKHAQLQSRLKTETAIDSIHTFRDPEED
ncbi:MgtC/SapB family protein [Occallatibacter riparius]|uniref:MgtC/SapB family protein n=1 Tax=Occallatibacter riparius TaxID=1002689 RepID=A0A9J7BMX3_9BACT|nr:MgtC/SapB family protein [Occallatibacter riparius]UWZ84236.1 MgtC/SapB family protein [Occallatibacter riparius]